MSVLDNDLRLAAAVAVECDDAHERMHSYGIYRIRARVIEASAIGTPRAELVDFLGPDDSDREMNQAAIDYQKPVVHHDKQLVLESVTVAADGSFEFWHKDAPTPVK